MGHYYKQDGTPYYYQSDGKDTTIKHARSQKLVPSVTEVINVAASPGLDIYKQNQLVLSCLSTTLNTTKLTQDQKQGFKILHKINSDKITNKEKQLIKSFIASDVYQEYKKQRVQMSKEHAKKASESGAVVHDALEQFFKSGRIIPEFAQLYKNVLKCFEDNDLPTTTGWIAEKSFASPLGFGGCVDLHHPEEKIILDFKTKSNDNFNKARAYASHHMQTAAYAVGIFVSDPLFNDEWGIAKTAKRYNLFTNKDNFSELKLTESKNFDRDWNMFYNLLEYWKLAKNYDGSF